MERASTIGRMALVLLASAAVVGCGPLPIAPPPGEPSCTTSGRRPEARPIALPLYRPAMGDRFALPEVIQANNAFALDLYHAMRSQPGNIVVSPACLTPGLAMLRAGRVARRPPRSTAPSIGPPRSPRAPWPL